MTLDEAITHCSEVIGEKYLEGHVRCASNHEQLKKWLEELKELKNPQPYKFEELHEGMFVYDIYEDFVYRINKIYKNEDIDLLIETGFGYAQTLTVRFEENRFFPLIKAMEYQGKAGDEK